MKHRCLSMSLVALAGTAQAQQLYFADIFSPTSVDGSIKRVDTSGFNLTPVLETGGGGRAGGGGVGGGEGEVGGAG